MKGSKFSVGASTPIEGSAMSDEEVKVLIEKLAISTLEDRKDEWHRGNNGKKLFLAVINCCIF